MFVQNLCSRFLCRQTGIWHLWLHDRVPDLLMPHCQSIVGSHAESPIQLVDHSNHAFVGLLHSDDVTELPDAAQCQLSTASDDTEPTQNISISSTDQPEEDLDHDLPGAQIDSGAKATVTNVLSLLWDV